MNGPTKFKIHQHTENQDKPISIYFNKSSSWLQIPRIWRNKFL